MMRSSLRLLLPLYCLGSVLVAIVLAQSSSAPSDDCRRFCCDEDCCGPGSIWTPGVGCTPNVTATGWNGEYNFEHEEGCVERTCCEERCCKEGVYWSHVTNQCEGTALFFHKDAFVVFGVTVTDFNEFPQCLPTNGFTHILFPFVPVGKTSLCGGAANVAEGGAIQCDTLHPGPWKARLELEKVPTSILDQHRISPGVTNPPIPPQPPNPQPQCFINYNIRFSVDCGPAKVQAKESSGCFNDADGTVACPIRQVCHPVGCFQHLIDSVVDVVAAEETKSCATTPLNPGLV